MHNVLWQIENMWVLCWNLDQFYVIRSLYNLSILLTHQFITIPRDQVVNCAHIIFLLENDNYWHCLFWGGTTNMLIFLVKVAGVLINKARGVMGPSKCALVAGKDNQPTCRLPLMQCKLITSSPVLSRWKWRQSSQGVVVIA